MPMPVPDQPNKRQNKTWTKSPGHADRDLPESRCDAILSKNVDGSCQTSASPPLHVTKVHRTDCSPVLRESVCSHLGGTPQEIMTFPLNYRTSCFQKHRALTSVQPHSMEQTWRLSELAVAMQHVVRLKQRSAMPPSMHSEPMTSPSATARMFTELHVRLNKMLSWPLRSKRA